MSRDKPHMILHIGAPKCGSSALQTVLSMTPDLQDRSGNTYRYTALQTSLGALDVCYGRALTRSAHLSSYGYATWPNFAPQVTATNVFIAMLQTMKRGQTKGHIPILSCEGWIAHHALFAQSLSEWGYPPVDVVVFLRPVVDWTNAAFWQWGIWSCPEIDRWLARNKMSTNFGRDIAAWAQIPNVRVIVRSMRPNVIAAFGLLYDLPLPLEKRSNTASSPALIGFLLRNRKFRITGHDASTEFVVQRWCNPIEHSSKLWALKPKHLHSLRPVVNDTLTTLRKVMPSQEFEMLLSDPGWTSEEPYHPAILAGLTNLTDPEPYEAFYKEICAGMKRASDVSMSQSLECPSPPGSLASVEDWDRVIAPVLDMLLKADGRIRYNTLPFWQRKIAPYIGKPGQSYGIVPKI